MSQTRQLAAIMFTDIVGYTALMGRDEEKAFELLKKNREIQKPLIKHFNGVWIKELGDGVLASFQTVTDAVMCAGSIQQSCMSNPDLKLRIGIHLGEVVFENNDVFGDGVNIASRLQTIAPVGGICISESVNNNVANKKGITARFFREEILKNVKDPVKVYELTFESFEFKNHGPSLIENARKKAIPSKSIAVLPFVDMSPSHDQEFLGDGLAEELINILSQINELKVTGRTSSFSFKRKDTDLTTIGKLLNVSTILEGSVQKSGNHIRITAQLINAEDGYHIWSKRYDREMADIFAIQDDISAKIAEHLKITILGDNPDYLPERKPVTTIQAYELLLRGRFEMQIRVEGNERAMECFTKAIELDPDYSDAYFYLGYTYFYATEYLFMPFIEGFQKTRECAKKALALDPNHDQAHLLMAHVYCFHDLNWIKAKLEWEKVREPFGSPVSINYMKFEPWFRALVYGDFDFAIDAMEKQVELEPNHLDNLMNVVMLNFYGRRFKQAREAAYKLLKKSPTHSEACRYLGRTYLFENRLEEAIEYARKSVEYSQGKGWSQSDLIVALIKGDKKKEAWKIISEIKDHNQSLLLPATTWVWIHAHLDEKDEAFKYLEMAFENKDFWLVSLKYSPEWDLLRSDPRFKKILEEMKFPDN